LVQFLKERTQNLIPLSRSVRVGSALYASNFPGQQLFKTNFKKLQNLKFSKQFQLIALYYNPVSRELHSTQFGQRVNTFLKINFSAAMPALKTT